MFLYTLIAYMLQIFLGLLIFVLAVVGIVVYLSLSSHCGKDSKEDIEYCRVALWFNDAIESIILVAMIAATVWVYYCITRLDVNPSPISFLDDLLLFICVPFFLLYCTLNLVAACMTDAEVNILVSSIPTNIVTVSKPFQKL